MLHAAHTTATMLFMPTLSGDDQTHSTLYARLRRPASSPHTPRSALPVLFFGDLFAAQVATLGVNPSHREYFDQQGYEMTDESRRFHTLTSLHAPSRSTLTDEQGEQAIGAMRSYFERPFTVFHWFHPLKRVLQGMNYSYQTRYALSRQWRISISSRRRRLPHGANSGSASPTKPPRCLQKG